MRENQKELLELIELDTSLLIEKCNLTSRNDCFKLLRTLKETSAFPSVINYDGVTFSTDDEKANAFNDFFSSVYSCRIYANVPTALDSSIKLQYATFGDLTIENILSKCDDSSSMGSDQVPSFLLRDGCQILVQRLWHFCKLFKSPCIGLKNEKRHISHHVKKMVQQLTFKTIVQSACFQSFLLFLKKCCLLFCIHKLSR